MRLKITLGNLGQQIMINIFQHKNRGGGSNQDTIEGQTSAEECNLLFDLARQIKKGCIVEIGSFRGKSTIFLAKGILAGKYNIPLYAIEPHESFTGVLGGQFGPHDRKAFFENILRAGVSEVVRLVNLSSEIIVPNWKYKVGLLWIDGDHTYEGVKRDIECWLPHHLPHAIIAFHDSRDPNLGPFQLIQELLRKKEFKVIKKVGLTTVLEKNIL